MHTIIVYDTAAVIVFHLRVGDMPAIEGYRGIIGISIVDVYARFKMLSLFLLHCTSPLIPLGFLRYHQGVIYGQNDMYDSSDVILTPLLTTKVGWAPGANNRQPRALGINFQMAKRCKSGKDQIAVV